MKKLLIFAAYVLIITGLTSCEDYNTFEVKGRITATSTCSKKNVGPPYQVEVEIYKGNKKIIDVINTDNDGKFTGTYPWIEKKSSPDRWRINGVKKDGKNVCDDPGCDTSKICSDQSEGQNKGSYSMDSAADFKIICQCVTPFRINIYSPYNPKYEFKYKLKEPGYYYLPPKNKYDEHETTKVGHPLYPGW